MCQLIRKTSYYRQYELHEKANCLTRVYVADSTACLRDNDNEVNTLHFKLQNLVENNHFGYA